MEIFAAFLESSVTWWHAISVHPRATYPRLPLSTETAPASLVSCVNAGGKIETAKHNTSQLGKLWPEGKQQYHVVIFRAGRSFHLSVAAGWGRAGTAPVLVV